MDGVIRWRIFYVRMVLAVGLFRPVITVERIALMIPATKISMGVPVMRGDLMRWCGHITVLHMVAANESEPSPANDALLKHLEETHEQIKAMCGAYDKLRSLVGVLEREQGVSEPRFYVDENAGAGCKSHCPVL